MGRKKLENKLKNTVVRMRDDTRALAELHGEGEVAKGVRAMIERLHGIMRWTLPRLTMAECKAVVQVIRPDFVGTAFGVNLGPMLATEIDDQLCDLPLAELEVDWEAFVEKCRKLDDIEVMALGYAAEAVLADKDEPSDLDARIARHFRVRG